MAHTKYVTDIHNRIEEFRDEVDKSILQNKNFTDHSKNFKNHTAGEHGSTQHWARHDSTCS